MAAYKRILLKLSGEALASHDPSKEGTVSGIDPLMLQKIAKDIKQVHDLGIQVCLVVGGGNIYRGMKGVVSHGIDRTTADYMGMLATVMNGLALQHAIEQAGLDCRLISALPMPSMGEPYIRRRAVRHLEKGRVILFVAGTGNPYFTTDTAAALRAAEMNCDLLLKATKVDGIYSDDPRKNPKAAFLSSLTYKDVLSKELAIMDVAAMALAREQKIPIAVFSIYKSSGLMDVIQGKGCFTIIRE